MKKKISDEKKTGIWIDQNKAFIIRQSGNKDATIEKVNSGVESRIRIKGEGKVFMRFGNAIIGDEEKKQKRQVHQRRQYFKQVMSKVQDDDYLYLFGPGNAKKGLQHAIEQDQMLHPKMILTGSADKLSKNKMKENVRNFFQSKEFFDAKSNLTTQH